MFKVQSEDMKLRCHVRCSENDRYV